MTTPIRTVGAVVVAFWPERYENLSVIVESLLEGVPCPEKITVINNHPKYRVDNIRGAEVINSGRNFTSRSKYPIALLDPRPYYLLLDDDTAVKPETLAYFMENAHAGACYSTWGRRFVNNYISQGEEFRSEEIEEPTRVDTFNGVLQFLSYQSIVNMLAVEPLIRFSLGEDYKFCSEDMLIAMANEAYVMPNIDPLHVPLSTHGVAMEEDWGYHVLRDVFAHKARLLLGGEPFVGRWPGDDEYDEAAIDKYLTTIGDREAHLLDPAPPPPPPSEENPGKVST